MHPQFSPGGKYVAYASNESGTHEIYVRAFPSGWPVWQVSSQGGSSPRWRADGRELYWISRGEDFPLMAAQMDFARSNPVVEVEALFLTGQLAGTFNYDVMPDGQFLMLEPIEEGDPGSTMPIPMRITLNWYEEFRDRERD